MASAVPPSTSSQENLETYCLVWLDNYANSSSENRQAQQQLIRIINQLLTFENEYQCLQHIQTLPKNDRVILIASGRFGRQIVPQIVDFRQITSIYIYCMDQRANERWARQYAKVKGVVTRLDELIRQIQKDYRQQEEDLLNEHLALKVIDHEKSSSNEFLRFHLLLDGLIRLNSPSDDKLELIAFCKQYYTSNLSVLRMIEEFEDDYSSDRAIWWLTRQTFLSRLLTKAFRDENLDLLYKFRFFVYDLARQLGKHRPSSSIRVYRSQLLSKEQLELLKTSTGKCVSINSFLLAHFDETKCRSLLQANQLNLEKVLFEIQVDEKLSHLRPFGNIQSVSYSSKIKEILFMIGSIFSIDRVTGDTGSIWTVKLSLCSMNHPLLKAVAQGLQTELSTGQINLFQYGNLLYRLGKVEHCQKYYCRYLNQLPDNHSDIPICYTKLAFIAEAKKNFTVSLTWYKKALQTLAPTDQTKLADVHNSIANVYSKTNDYPHAIKSYRKALTIWKTLFGENHSSIIKCLNNIGAVYDMKKNYSKALDYYQKAYELCQALNDPDLALTARNMASTYELQGHYQQAAEHYEKALDFYRKSSLGNDIYIKDIQASLQRVSSKIISL